MLTGEFPNDMGIFMEEKMTMPADFRTEKKSFFWYKEVIASNGKKL
jgi:beta-glucosidase/6-phospho-beta-glucosidase/beta-galactosidase